MRGANPRPHNRETVTGGFMKHRKIRSRTKHSIISSGGHPSRECPRYGAEDEIGVLLCEEHYFQPSRHVIIHTCGVCGQKFQEEYHG